MYFSIIIFLSCYKIPCKHKHFRHFGNMFRQPRHCAVILGLLWTLVPSRDACHAVIKRLFPFRSDSRLRCLLSQTESCFAFGECFIPTKNRPCHFGKVCFWLECCVNLILFCVAKAGSHFPFGDRQACLSSEEGGNHEAERSYPVIPTKICALRTKKSVLFARLGLFSLYN